MAIPVEHKCAKKPEPFGSGFRYLNSFTLQNSAKSAVNAKLPTVHVVGGF